MRSCRLEKRRQRYATDDVFREDMKRRSRESKAKLTEEERKDRHYKRVFGVPYAWVLELLASQGGCCAMCSKPVLAMGKGADLG